MIAGNTKLALLVESRNLWVSVPIATVAADQLAFASFVAFCSNLTSVRKPAPFDASPTSC